MLYVLSTNLKSGQWTEFQKWIALDGADLIRKASPDGWRLRGVYLTAFNLGDAHVEVHWEVENYGAFDSAREAASKGAAWAATLERLHSFLDPAASKARLLTDVGAGIIVGC